MVAGLITGGIGAAAGLAGSLYGMTQNSGGIGPEEAAWRDWTRVVEPVGTYMNQSIFNPMYYGRDGGPGPHHIPQDC